MIKQTLNGKAIIIIPNRINNKYWVCYEQQIYEMNEAPVTDQDVEKLEKQKNEIMLQRDGIVWSKTLIDLLSSLN